MQLENYKALFLLPKSFLLNQYIPIVQWGSFSGQAQTTGPNQTKEITLPFPISFTSFYKIPFAIPSDCFKTDTGRTGIYVGDFCTTATRTAHYTNNGLYLKISSTNYGSGNRANSANFSYIAIGK